MSAENKALIRRWFEEVWNKGRVEAIDEMFHNDGIVHGLGGYPDAKLHGPEGFKPFFNSFRSAFPDIKVEVDHIISEHDMVAARCIVRATHTGHGLGINPSHKPILMSGIALTRIKDGKIIEAWNNFDFMGMYQQMGATQFPQPASKTDT